MCVQADNGAPSVAQASDKVEALIARLIERKGGYVNNPSDHGGPTKYPGRQQRLLTS